MGALGEVGVVLIYHKLSLLFICGFGTIASRLLFECPLNPMFFLFDNAASQGGAA